MNQANLSPNTNTSGASLSKASLKVDRPFEIGEGQVLFKGEASPFSYEVKKDVKGSSALEVNQASTAETGVFSSLAAVISLLIRRPETVAAVAALSVGALNTLKADAALMPAGANDSLYRAYGAQHNSNLLWVEAEYQGFVFRFSAIRINDNFAITAGHGVFSDVGFANINQVGTGTNYFNNQGITRNVSQVIVYPTYSGINNDFSQPDIAIIRFSQPLSGTNLTIGASGSISVGEVVTSAGFGTPGFAGSGFLPADGNVRGWDSSILSSNPLNVNPAYYWSTRFSSATQIPMNGRGSNGDSGSVVLDNNGLLIGMTVAGAPSQLFFGPIGSTQFLDLTNPEVRDWIEANTVPTPGVLALFTIASLSVARRRR